MVSPDQHITIQISHDGYEAHACSDGSGSLLMLAELQETLGAAGVVHGIIEESLQAVINGQSNGQPIVVAKGSRPSDGQDGHVEYFFDHEKASPAEEEFGKVNLHEMHYIHNVRQGERLALIHPPQAGVPGVTVTGRAVPAKDGKKALVHAGQHSMFKPEDPLTLLANSDGNVILKLDGTIEVLPTLTISGNVDFATGNIDFIGSLKVMGDIKSDFAVKVQKDLEVMGNVEDAHLEVGGALNMRKGFIGVGKGVAKAKGNVTVRHVLNQTIISEGDVVIERECVNGNIRAGARIAAIDGIIAGGRLEAEEEVDVKTIGGGEHSQSHVRVGRKGRIIERMVQLEKEMSHIAKQVGDVKDGVYRLIRMKLDTGSLTPEREQMLVKLQEVQKLLPVRHHEMELEKARLTESLKQDCKARVVVRGTVFENVLIDINAVRKLLEVALQDVVFVERAGEIEARSA